MTERGAIQRNSSAAPIPPEYGIPQLAWTFFNYPSWKRRMDFFLEDHQLLHTCTKTFYNMAAGQLTPWTENERRLQKSIFEGKSNFTLELLKAHLCPKLEVQVRSLTPAITSPKQLVEHLEMRYAEELPIIQKKIEAEWANWSLKPLGGLNTMALSTMELLATVGKRNKPAVVDGQRVGFAKLTFLDGFDKLERIRMDSLKHGRRISHKDFIAKFVHGMSQVTDKNKAKAECVDQVAKFLWAFKEPSIKQVREVVKEVVKRQGQRSQSENQ